MDNPHTDEPDILDCPKCEQPGESMGSAFEPDTQTYTCAARCLQCEIIWTDTHDDDGHVETSWKPDRDITHNSRLEFGGGWE
jgi:hypothetical protein